MIETPITALPSGHGPRPDLPRHEDLHAAARQLEATFLAEMFAAAGLGNAPEGFGGGAGEEQFASFLRQAQAEEMARGGGIGLAEAIFSALVERADG